MPITSTGTQDVALLFGVADARAGEVAFCPGSYERQGFCMLFLDLGIEFFLGDPELVSLVTDEVRLRHAGNLPPA